MTLRKTKLKSEILPTLLEFATTQSVKMRFSAPLPDKLNTMPLEAVKVNLRIEPPLDPENIVPPALTNLSSFVSWPDICASFKFIGTARLIVPFIS